MRSRGHPRKFAIERVVSQAIFLLAAVLVAFALKWQSRHAVPQDIDWLLGPTACLVQEISGREFVAEQGIGYIDRDLGFVIAPECAGLNFLIAAFLTCVIGFASRSSSVRSRVFFLVVSAAIAFPVTLGANTVRILIAIAIHRRQVTLAWCLPADLHRIDGIVVFFGALCLLHLTLQACMPGDSAGEGGRR